MSTLTWLQPSSPLTLKQLKTYGKIVVSSTTTIGGGMISSEIPPNSKFVRYQKVSYSLVEPFYRFYKDLKRFNYSSVYDYIEY